ncbi:hypothetical protein ACI6Q2_03885 [Chitinophagaceae bacterium LWZ2-11]
MSRLRIYNPDTSSSESILRERAIAYMKLSPKEKLQELFALIAAARKLNNGQPLKTPQGKGIIITKKNK